MQATLVVQPLSAILRMKSPRPFSSAADHSVLVMRQGSGSARAGKDAIVQEQRMIAMQIRLVMNDIPSTDSLIYSSVKGGFQRGGPANEKFHDAFALKRKSSV